MHAIILLHNYKTKEILLLKKKKKCLKKFIKSFLYMEIVHV